PGGRGLHPHPPTTPRISCSRPVGLRLSDQQLHFCFPVPAVPARGADTSQFPGVRPPGHRFRVHFELQCHFAGGEQAVVPVLLRAVLCHFVPPSSALAMTDSLSRAASRSARAWSRSSRSVLFSLTTAMTAATGSAARVAAGGVNDRAAGSVWV